MAFHHCNPSIWWAEAQASLQVQDQPGLHDEFQSSQGYIGRHCQEQKLKGCLRCGSVTGYLPGVCVALGSINPSTRNEKQGRDWLQQRVVQRLRDRACSGLTGVSSQCPSIYFSCSSLLFVHSVVDKQSSAVLVTMPRSQWLELQIFTLPFW